MKPTGEQSDLRQSIKNGLFAFAQSECGRRWHVCCSFRRKAVAPARQSRRRSWRGAVKGRPRAGRNGPLTASTGSADLEERGANALGTVGRIQAAGTGRWLRPITALASLKKVLLRAPRIPGNRLQVLLALRAWIGLALQFRAEEDVADRRWFSWVSRGLSRGPGVCAVPPRPDWLNCGRRQERPE